MSSDITGVQVLEIAHDLLRVFQSMLFCSLAAFRGLALVRTGTHSAMSNWRPVLSGSSGLNSAPRCNVRQPSPVNSPIHIIPSLGDANGRLAHAAPEIARLSACLHLSMVSERTDLLKVDPASTRLSFRLRQAV